MKANFSNFLVRESNEFAYLCAKEFAENINNDKSDKTFAGLCTHLLLSIKDELEKNNPSCKILYI